MSKYNILTIGHSLPDLSKITKSYSVNVINLPSLSAYDYIDYLKKNDFKFILIHLEQPAKVYINFVSSLSHINTIPKILMFGKNKFRNSHYCESDSIYMDYKEQSLYALLKAATLSYIEDIYPNSAVPSLLSQEMSDLIYNILLGVTDEEYRQIKKLPSFNLSTGPQYVFVATSHATKAVARSYPVLKKLYQRLSDESLLEFSTVLDHFYGGTVIKNGWQEIIVIINDIHSNSKTLSDRFGYDIAVALYNCIDTNSTYCYMLSRTADPRILSNSFSMLPVLKRHRLFFRELRVLGLENYQKKHYKADQAKLNAALNVVAQYSLSFDDKQLETACRDIFLNQLKPSSDLTSYYYCASTLNVIYRQFCDDYTIDYTHDFHFYNYEGRWIEDVCDEYINMFLNAKQQILKSNQYGNLTFYRIKKHIDETYNQKLTLDFLCERFNISKSHLCRLFRKNLGTTVVSYINGVRISNARRILLSKDVTIAQLAYQVGFDDPKYFNRVFKNIVGVSPGKYSDMMIDILPIE